MILFYILDFSTETQVLYINFIQLTSLAKPRFSPSHPTGRSYGALVNWMDSNADEVALWERMMTSPNEWVEDVLPLRMLTTAKTVLK